MDDLNGKVKYIKKCRVIGFTNNEIIIKQGDWDAKWVSFDKIEKTIFITKEKAEARLKELLESA